MTTGRINQVATLTMTIKSEQKSEHDNHRLNASKLTGVFRVYILAVADTMIGTVLASFPLFPTGLFSNPNQRNQSIGFGSNEPQALRRLDCSAS